MSFSPRKIVLSLSLIVASCSSAARCDMVFPRYSSATSSRSVASSAGMVSSPKPSGASSVIKNEVTSTASCGVSRMFGMRASGFQCLGSRIHEYTHSAVVLRARPMRLGP